MNLNLNFHGTQGIVLFSVLSLAFISSGCKDSSTAGTSSSASITESKSVCKLLESATTKAKVQRIVALVEDGKVDLHERYEVGFTALHCAASRGDIGLIEALIRAGADLEATDNTGNTPLFDAVENFKPDACLFLLKHGADVNHANSHGETPLFQAIGSKRVESVRVLLAHGADVRKRSVTGATPLHQAASLGTPAEIVLLLLQAGASPDEGDNTGWTPERSAETWNNQEFLNIIKAHRGQ